MLCSIAKGIQNSRRNPIVSKFEPRIHSMFYLCLFFRSENLLGQMILTHRQRRPEVFHSDLFNFSIFIWILFVRFIKMNLRNSNTFHEALRKILFALNALLGIKCLLFPNQFVIQALNLTMYSFIRHCRMVGFCDCWKIYFCVNVLNRESVDAVVMISLFVNPHTNTNTNLDILYIDRLIQIAHSNWNQIYWKRCSCNWLSIDRKIVVFFFYRHNEKRLRTELNLGVLK